MAHGQQIDQQTRSAGPAKKKPRGKPFPAGVSGNPSGVAAAPEPPDDGLVTAGRMRKVLGQPKGADAGPTEKQLRKWLDKDPKGYTEAIDRKAKQADDPGVAAELAAYKAETERLRGELAGAKRELAADPEDDPGTDAALAQIEKLLKGGGDGPGPVH